MELLEENWLYFTQIFRYTVAAKIKFPQRSEKVAIMSLRLKNHFRLRTTYVVARVFFKPQQSLSYVHIKIFRHIHHCLLLPGIVALFAYVTVGLLFTDISCRYHASWFTTASICQYE